MFFLNVNHVNIEAEEDDEHRVENQTAGHLPLRGHRVHQEIERCREHHVREDGAHGIVDGILALAHQVGEHHRSAIAGHTAPGARHVAVARNENDVDRHQYGATRQREPGAPNGAVDEFVPEGEIEIDAHHNLRHHDDGHHLHAAAITLAHNELEQVEIAHHAKEGQEGEDEKILHAQSVERLGVFVACGGEDHRLVGIAKGLSDHRHDHGYLDAAAVDAQEHVGRLLVGIDQREKYLVGHLVENARNAQHEDGPGVREHAPQEHAVEAPFDFKELRDEEQRDEGGADEVDEEDVEDRRQMEPHEADEVEGNVEGDEEQLERSRAQGALLEPQERERQRLQGIHRHYDCHHQEILRMRAVAQIIRNGTNEGEDAEEKNARERSDEGKARGEDGVGPKALVVGVAEERRLHAEGEDHQNERHVGIDVGADAVVARSGRHIVGVERHEQVVEKTTHYAGQTVDGCVFS